MDNVQVQPTQEEFVTDARGCKRAKKARRGWKGLFNDLSPEQDAVNHAILAKLYRPGTDREQKLAELCGADMKSSEWKASLRWLSDRGYVVWVRQEWDGVVKAEFV